MHTRRTPKEGGMTCSLLPGGGAAGLSLAQGQHAAAPEEGAYYAHLVFHPAVLSTVVPSFRARLPKLFSLTVFDPKPFKSYSKAQLCRDMSRTILRNVQELSGKLPGTLPEMQGKSNYNMLF